MHNNKQAIIWSSLLSVLSLVISILLHCLDFEYVSNLFSGVFASGILTTLIAIINYRTERKRTLEKFYSYMRKAIGAYNRFENSSDLESSIDSVLLIDEFDYLELDNAFGDIEFIFNHKKNYNYIYDSLYKITLELRALINEKAFHFRLYRKAKNGNHSVMEHFISEVDNYIMERTETELQTEDGNSIKMTTCRNRVVEELEKELTGKYYRMMYPHIKEEKHNAD